MWLPIKTLFLILLFVLILFLSIGFYIEKTKFLNNEVNCEKFLYLYNTCISNCKNYSNIILTENCDKINLNKGKYNIICLEKNKCLITS